jgi:lipopolysaccharide export system permease protein
MAHAPFRLRLLDRYLLTQMAPPMAAAFGVVLISLLLYRILEIFNLLAASSAQFELAAQLIGGLLPHYLGLALPAGYFISTFVVVVRMSDSSEVDALLASGFSLDRLAVPFACVGVLVTAASLILLGYLQPYGRYGYNLGMNEARASAWNARLQPRTFLQAQDGRLVVTADSADATGRTLRGVFLRRIDRDDREQVFTARTGLITPADDGRRVLLTLRDGAAMREAAGEPTVGDFDVFTFEAPAAAVVTPFRARGSGPRELTMPELVERMRRGETAEARRRAESEFHTRIVRAISPLFLPFLAMPLGIAAKRARRSAGFIVAAAVLLIYEYAIDGAQAAADLGLVRPALAVWTPFTAFALLCCGLYAMSRRRPGQNPLAGVVGAVGAAFEAMAALFKRPVPAASSASR